MSSSGNLTLDLSAGSFDAYVRVYDAVGNLIAFDDDSGPNTNSHLSLIVQPGSYFVSTGAYNDADTGTYSLSGTFTLDDHADSFSSFPPNAFRIR